MSHVDELDPFRIGCEQPGWRIVYGAADELGPEPILAAIDNYRGTIVDLDQNLTIDVAALAKARRDLLQKLRSGGLQAGRELCWPSATGRCSSPRSTPCCGPELRRCWCITNCRPRNCGAPR